MENLLTVDRNSFINWVNGVLLSFHNGEGFVVDETACMAAEKDLDNGKEILLTIEGRIVSKMKLTDDGYVETQL